MLPELLGCYQSQTTQRMGKTGNSSRDFTQRINWMALRLDAVRILIFPLDDKKLPMPLQKIVTSDEFLVHFLPAPLVFNEQLAPAAVTLARLLTEAKEPLEQKALPDAERTLFTCILIALSAVGEGDDDTRVLAVLRKAGPDGLGGESQKVAINAFGIHLRKQKQYDAAIAYYRQALELAPADERIMFNLARVLFEKGEVSACQELLGKAIGIDGAFPEAQKFLRYLKRHGDGAAVRDLSDITI